MKNELFIPFSTETTKRTVRCECGSSHAERGEMEDGTPAWKCANCGNVSKRTKRTSAKQQRRNDLIAQLLADAE